MYSSSSKKLLISSFPEKQCKVSICLTPYILQSRTTYILTYNTACISTLNACRGEQTYNYIEVLEQLSGKLFEKEPIF